MKMLWLFLLSGMNVFAQTLENIKGSPGEYEGIAGNPYLLKDWSDGIIRFSSGKVTDKFKLKFNAAQNRLLLQFNGSAFAAESKIDEFVIYTKNKKDSLVFKKGFPVSDRGNAETFYQVHESGPATLVQLYAKDIIQEKEILDSKTSRRYQDVEEYYLAKDGIMYKLNRENASIADILSDRRDELKSFISQQQLKMRSAEDYAKVVKKYNDLLTH